MRAIWTLFHHMNSPLTHAAAGMSSFSRPVLKSSGRPAGLLVAGVTKTWTEEPVVQAKASNSANLG